MKDSVLEYSLSCSSDTTGSLPRSSSFDQECLSTLLSIVHSSPEVNKKCEIIEEYILNEKS